MMTFSEACEAAAAICRSTEGTEVTPLEAFAAAGWEVCFHFFGEAGRNKLWEDPAVTAYNAALEGDYARDFGHVFSGLYRGSTPEERAALAREVGFEPTEGDTWQDPALYYIGGKMGNTVRAAIFPPGQKPDNPFMYG